MTDQEKIMLSVMKELEKKDMPGWGEPKCFNYEIDNDEFGNIIEMCQKAGYIINAKVQRGGKGNKVTMVWLNQARLTAKGFEYLKSNSSLMKLYRGLKAFREWLPR